MGRQAAANGTLGNKVQGMVSFFATGIAKSNHLFESNTCIRHNQQIHILLITDGRSDLIIIMLVKETTMLNTLKNRKLSYAGHIMRNTSGHYDTLLTTIEGRLNGKRGRGRPRRTWVDDIRDWTGSKRYEQIKRAAETRRLHGKCATHSSGRNTMNEC